MRLSTLPCALGALLACALATADGPEKHQVFLSLLGGNYEEPDDLNLRRGDFNLGGAIGWARDDRWSVEAMFFDLSPQAEINGVRAKADMDYWSLNLIRKFGSPEDWQPYVTVGGGIAEYDYGGLRTDVQDNLYSAGLGFFGDLSDRLALRADVRGVYHHDSDNVSPMVTAGLTLMLGGSPTPPPPSDSDGDGVADTRDGCPGTPAGVEVDERGCPPESDRDGDGVADDADRCPGTRSGVAVDSRGCPRDSDGDRVSNDRDACPDTPTGARVDERGCELPVERPVSFDLTMEFGFDSAEITGARMQEILEVLRFLREYPSTTAVIEGHTDSVGAELYNKMLSEQRAQSVLEALVNSGIDRGRLEAIGYGETRPIASNDSEAGRAENRRVTVVVAGTTTEPSN